MRFLSLCMLGSILLNAAPSRPVIIPPSSLVSKELALSGESELSVVERLVATTELQLETVRHLKEEIALFQLEREAFALGDYSKKRASLMVRHARSILEIITELHIQHLFSSEFLEELQLFSSIAGKTQIKKP